MDFDFQRNAKIFECWKCGQPYAVSKEKLDWYLTEHPDEKLCPICLGVKPKGWYCSSCDKVHLSTVDHN